MVSEGREVGVSNFEPLGEATSFQSVLSLPMLLDGLVPMLAAAVDGDPATLVLQAGRLTPPAAAPFCCGCSYIACMVAITIRDVPAEARDVLASRAALAGQSMQEYLRGLLVEVAEKPTVAEVMARARARAEATGTRLTVDEILARRDADRR